jgi:hypothetical protein
MLQLFQDAVPSIPVSTAAPPPPPVIQQSTFTNFASPENTIDEPVWDTIKRDVVTIGRNLKSVLIPVQGEFVGREAALRNWDLWGPLVSSTQETAACCRHSPHSLARAAQLVAVLPVIDDAGYQCRPTVIQHSRPGSPFYPPQRAAC